MGLVIRAKGDLGWLSREIAMSRLIPQRKGFIRTTNALKLEYAGINKLARRKVATEARHLTSNISLDDWKVLIIPYHLNPSINRFSELCLRDVRICL